ncbi:MAG: M3 family metallopeptidase, partial [Planctomycetota bacterium]
DAGVLAKFAHHEDTGEAIPADLVATLRRAEEWGKGLQFGVQVFYGMVSLELHGRSSIEAGGEPWNADALQKFESELQARWSPFPYEEGTCFLASFGHLNGYAAAYYTYLWSLIIAKDLFGSFGSNLMDRATADRYRQEVIGRGGSREANELVRAFLGRDYAHEAFEDYLKS